MKLCLSCEHCFASSLSTCPACSTNPMVSKGVVMFAPELALEGSGFSPAFFEDLANLEQGNFWFRARNHLVMWAISRYCKPDGEILEVGCGTGFVVAAIAEHYPGARVHGSEIFLAGLAFAKQRAPAVEFFQMDGRRIPFRNEFDLVGAFDVIEHIDEDEAVLAQMFFATKPGGKLTQMNMLAISAAIPSTNCD
jgi:ubiquinone/menaquinone biosynthesis C-methylase UbiE